MRTRKRSRPGAGACLSQCGVGGDQRQRPSRRALGWLLRHSSEVLHREQQLLVALGADPFRINNSGQILASSFRRTAPFVLSDGEGLTFLESPDTPDVVSASFTDLNNRGQIVGWWVELVADPHRTVARGLLREPDGVIAPVDWNYPWPALVVRRLGGEDVTLRLVQPLGTQLHGINDRGDVLAVAQAQYASDYSWWNPVESVWGVRQPSLRTTPEGQAEDLVSSTVAFPSVRR